MIDWRWIRTRLLVAVAVVAGLGLAIELWHARSHAELVEILLPKLSLSYEANLPTWFSSSLLLACAVAAGSIAAARQPLHRHWWCIAALATYLSLDEAAEIHEHLGGHLDTTGWLYFDWVVPASLIVVALVVVFVPFIRALHPRTRLRLIIAGAIYVGGALIMELPLGRWTDVHGSENLGYALIDWVEETMEMIGATLAFVALLAHREHLRRAPTA